MFVTAHLPWLACWTWQRKHTRSDSSRGRSSNITQLSPRCGTCLTVTSRRPLATAAVTSTALEHRLVTFARRSLSITPRLCGERVQCATARLASTEGTALWPCYSPTPSYRFTPLSWADTHTRRRRRSWCTCTLVSASSITWATRRSSCPPLLNKNTTTGARTLTPLSRARLALPAPPAACYQPPATSAPHLLTSPAPLTLPATVTAPPSLPPPPPPRMYHCRRRLRPRPPQRSSCDVLLVDGDHGHRGALQDIRNMRALAKPGAVLLVDDLDEGPGPALRQAQAEGLVEMLEMRMFNASTVADEVNPCIRRVRAPMWNCKTTWGWAVARYL